MSLEPHWSNCFCMWFLQRFDEIEGSADDDQGSGHHPKALGDDEDGDDDGSGTGISLGSLNTVN